MPWCARGSIAILFVAALDSAVHAQTTGAIEGRVLDARNRAPLEGVLVVAVSSSLQGRQTAVSDRGGAFTFPFLLPGTCELTASREGFADAVLHDVPVPLDRIARVELSLVPSFTESLEVHGSNPIVPQDSQGAATITREQLSL